MDWPRELDTWDDQIAALPGAHVLQTREWAGVKSAFGWKALPRLWRRPDGSLEAAALVLERTVSPLRLRVQYVPRGPLLDWDDAGLRQRILAELVGLARKRGAIFIKMDPELVIGEGVPGTPEAFENPAGAAVEKDLLAAGGHFSQDQIQFRNTIWVELNQPENERLAHLKQKWRYNLRLAEKKGVQVRSGTLTDLPLFYRMYAETAVRDGFAIRSQEYYLAVWRKFMECGMATPLLAEVQGEVVAGLMLFYYARRAWYLYGMSRPSHRDWMPNYLLQWEAMQRATALGCTVYDLWGAPDVFDESDSMWGVFRFKEGMGGRVIRTLGAWDIPTRPWLYFAYTRLLPRLMELMRRRGQARTQREVSL